MTCITMKKSMSTLRIIYGFLLVYHIHAAVLDINPQNTEQESKNISLKNLSQTLKNGPSLGTAIVNTQVLTILNYHGSQVYVYSSLSNEKENIGSPQKWVFYFVPIMLPDKRADSISSWAFVVNNEIRINLMLSNDDVVEMARIAIIKKYGLEVSQYSKFWDIAPLMIDSLTAYIVRGVSLPVEGIHPYKALHPNQLTMQFRFFCSSKKHAEETVDKIIDDIYQIEVGFHFAGFRQVTTNMISISSDQLKSVTSRTIADGGNKNSHYIHRNQGSKFVSKYTTNVKKMIYTENLNTDAATLSAGLEDQFIALLQQGMLYSEEIKISASFYNQVWAPSDLNPDRITSELTKLFIYNKTETARHNFSDNYFDFDRKYAESSSDSGKVQFSILNIGGSGNAEWSSSSFTHLMTTKQSIFSQTEIQDILNEESIETEWNGEKFIPKSFSVYRLTDITDRLQVAIIAKQLIAQQTNGAIIRTVNTGITSSSSAVDRYSWPLVGEIKLYASNESFLPRHWVFCHGQHLSRIEYQRLFFVIGEKFGAGDGETTFNVPDFRGRFPLGVNSTTNEEVTMEKGGSPTQIITVDHMPAHTHDTGTLKNAAAGSHTHFVHDPGHNHGGQTDAREGGSGGWNLKGNGRGPFDDWARHSHSIPIGATGIWLASNGLHSHEIEGSSASTGEGQPFSIMPPYQSIEYIIFTGV